MKNALGVRLGSIDCIAIHDSLSPLKQVRRFHSEYAYTSLVSQMLNDCHFELV